jgi:hypothetical protein
MTKPIYRYLADRKWREYQRKIIVQRIEQLGIVPDVLPFFEPTAEVRLAFRQKNVQPGEFVDSRISEVPPRLKVQVFDKGERLVTIVVIDSDVPVLLKKMGFPLDVIISLPIFHSRQQKPLFHFPRRPRHNSYTLGCHLCTERIAISPLLRVRIATGAWKDTRHCFVERANQTRWLQFEEFRG